jgi:hypothetical protein
MEESSKLRRIAERKAILIGEARTDLGNEYSTIGRMGVAS